MPTVSETRREPERSVVLPYWLDRPPEEAVEIAVAAERAGFTRLWIGEMATFDAFALATAIGLRAPGLRLCIGPLAIGVRSPVGIALGVSSVATLTGSAVDVALGASSPAIVSGWHDRPWEGLPTQMRETVTVLRALLGGGRGDCDGARVRTHGFRLQRPVPAATITVAAFGPAMTRVAARVADTVVLNLVTPEHVATVRALLDTEAKEVGKDGPRLAVWVPAALDPGLATLAQLSSQIAVYLRPPGYGEMFAALGFGSLVDDARRGRPRHELAAAIPRELLIAVGAIGSVADIDRRITAFHSAGTDDVAIVPATAEDPAGARLLSALRASSM
jgi:probable F420-dependent oxidoreductase